MSFYIQLVLRRIEASDPTAVSVVRHHRPIGFVALQVEEAAKVANCHDFISAFPQASMNPLVVV